MLAKRKSSFLDAFDDFFETLEGEFEKWRGTLAERPSWIQRACAIEPLNDMKITPTEVMMTVDLPLTKKDGVQVRAMNQKTLQISAEMKRKIQFAEFGITHRRGEFHKLQCHIHIPVPVQMNRMKLDFKKGILVIRLPRKHGR